MINQEMGGWYPDDYLFDTAGGLAWLELEGSLVGRSERFEFPCLQEKRTSKCIKTLFVWVWGGRMA